MSTSSCASLGDVGFHGMQDLDFGSLQSTPLLGHYNLPPLQAHASSRVGPTLRLGHGSDTIYNNSTPLV